MPDVSAPSAFAAAAGKTASPMGRAQHRERIIAAVALSLLLLCICLVAQEGQSLGLREALSSILSLSVDQEAEAASVIRKCDAGATRTLSQMLMTSARSSYDRGDLTKSVFLYECAVEAARRSGDDVLLGEAAYRLGTTCFHTQDYRRAEESLLEGIRLSEHTNSEVGLINNLATLGALRLRLARYEAAEQASKRALSLITASSKRTSIQYQFGEATVSGNLGTIAARNGESATALSHFNRAVELFEQLDKAVGGYQPSALDNLISIGELHYDLGDYREALSYFGRVLAAAEKHEYTHILQSVLDDLGILYMDQADFAKATDLFARSLNLANKIGDREAATVATCNQAVSSERQGMYPRANELFGACLRLANQGSRPEFTIPALEGLATVYHRTGQHNLALEYYDRALDIAIELGDKLRQSELAWWKASVFYDLKNYETSIGQSQRARQLADEIHEPNYLYLALTLIGKNYLALGRHDLASSTLALAIQKVEEIRNQVGGQAQQRAFFFERKIEPYYLMVELLVKQGKLGEALEFAERTRSRTLLDLLGSTRIDIARAMSSAEKQEEQKLSSQQVASSTQLSREYGLQHPDGNRIIDLKSRLDKARVDYDSFLDVLYTAHPELRIDRGQAPPFTIQDAKFALPSHDAAVVEFEVSEDKVHVFVLWLDAGGGVQVKAYQISIEKTNLTEKVEQLHTRIANNGLGVDKPSLELFQLLLGPAAPILAGKKELVLVPDDVLWELPFQALRDGSGHYLIENSAISYTPSLTALREMMKRKSSRLAAGHRDGNTSFGQSLLALGNPLPASGTVDLLKAVLPDERLGPLPGAKREVEAVGKLYDASLSKVLIGAEATEARAISEMPHFAVLHFATHGMLDGRNPLYSHIVLSRSGSDANEDGLLEAREIMNMSLNADIAILSACQTGRGRASTGEGVIGMSWAFFVAGCPTTVVSQWSVESDSTTRLMIDFHSSLRSFSKDSPYVTGSARALRDAQLKMIKDPKYSHPFCWAGFIVVGDGW